jgi:hypothetical protein
MPTNPLYNEYILDSKNYWCQVRGSEDPPAPSYRMVKGIFGSKRKLGRYMDPYGCMAIMQNQKDLWHQWYPSFLVSSAIGPVLTGVGWAFMIVVFPILATIYLCKRGYRRRKYDHYYRVLQEIEATGEPVWVPYDRERRRLIDVQPNAIWP